jgi:hypothetical protein
VKRLTTIASRHPTMSTLIKGSIGGLPAQAAV